MVIWMIRGTGHSQSSGAFQPVEKTTKKSYPGHLKMMQDLKAARAKIDKQRKDFIKNPQNVKAREQLEQLRLDQEPENTRLMRIKYEEKQAEKMFIEEQKSVEDKLVEFNLKNKEHLRETKEKYEKIKNSDNIVINANQEARQKELLEIEKLKVLLEIEQREKAKSEKIKADREIEKEKLTFELKQMSIYETFLMKVMLASEEQEKDEKPKEAMRKMIDRYERLKNKQNDLKIDLREKENSKKEKIEKMSNMKRDMQNEIFKLNSDIHKTQKDIDELLKKLRDIDLEISEKVRMNQDKMIESAKIEMAVNNLHRMATESKNKKQKEALKQNSMEQQPKISLIEDLTHKLEEIQDKMAELKFYYKTFKGHR